MPYKDPEIRRIKAREYTRNYKLRLSPKKLNLQKKQKRDHMREILASKTPEQKIKFYKRMYVLAQKSGQYDDIAEQAVKAYHKLRDRVLSFLGGRCSNPNCKWVNDDGTYGCNLKSCLQIDHVNGGGRREKEKGASLLRKVLKDTTGAYQLLCSNCNWIKRIEKHEVRVSPYLKKVA